MGFLERRSNDTFILNLNIKPNSIKQKFNDDGDYLTIYLRSKPVLNKANKELINLLKKKLKISTNQIHIISGSKSINKLIALTFFKEIDEKEILKRILS